MILCLRLRVIIYGRNPVREAIRGPGRCCASGRPQSALREPWLAAVGIACRALPRPRRSQRRCGSADHQGICAEVVGVSLRGRGGAAGASPDALIVALDQVQDPQNLGAICRTAECAGAAGVVLPERRSAEVTPAVCKASAGAVEHLPIARVRNLADFLAEAKPRGLWCYGADAGGSVAYDAVDFGGPGGAGAGVRGARAAAPCRGGLRRARVSCRCAAGSSR